MMEALSPANIGLLLFGIFFVLLLIGSPIMVALGVATMACFIVLDIDLSLMIERAFASLTAFPLMALPAFVLAGSLMEAAGVSRRLVHVAENIVGPTPGGLAISTTLSCVFFGAISGSGPATTAAVGMLMIPAMAKRGYNVGYAAAATATAGGIGIIIPPSIPMVIYGVSGQQSISKMFMAGIIPGILIAIGLSVMHFFLCRNLKTEGLDWSMKTFIHSLRDGFWSILAPVIILGGIYAGIFTPTEAAVVAIFYTILVGIFIHKELTLKSFMASLKTTSWLTGRVLVLVFTATAFGYLLTSYRIPVEIANWILSFTNNVNLVWFFVVILLLFLGHKLMDILCNYQGYQKCVLILVFDAYRVPGSPGAIEQYHNIHVVYTKEAETADMFIERVTHEIGKSRRVRVATSDGMEQVIILGHGALRVSARMFHEEVQNVEKQIRALVQGQA